MKKKIILWTNGIDHFSSEDGSRNSIGGIQVQMHMWGVTLGRNGWEVYTFTSNYNNKNRTIQNIKFIFLPTIKLINPIISVFYAIYYLAIYRPQIILFNGANRDLLFVNLLSIPFNCKIIQMFASDSDLEPEKELIDRKLDRYIFRLGLRLTNNFIVQNTNQANLLEANYKKKNPLLIPLIWIDNNDLEEASDKKEIILWVSNFRQLKRPEWFLQLAFDKPEYKFIMVGNSTDNELFERCKKRATEIPNLEFMGGLPFDLTNELFKKASLFICTSEIEGFPNTFLQAWMNKCPILTTFDPSDLIKKHEIGIYCKNYQDIKTGFDQFLDEEYKEIVISNISGYFKNTFSAQMHYERLIDRFNLK